MKPRIKELLDKHTACFKTSDYDLKLAIAAAKYRRERFLFECEQLLKPFGTKRVYKTTNKGDK